MRPVLLAAVTAAGRSRRMGAPKPLLQWSGRTLLAAIVGTLRRNGIARPVVIVAPGAEEIRAEALAAGGFPLVNGRAAEGRFTSIRLAARWALAHPRTAQREPALLLWPVDCPAVSDDTIARLAAAAAREPGRDVVPCHGGRGGHPVLLGRPTLERIAAAPDGANLRDLLRKARPAPLRLEVPDRAVLDNLNRPADLDALGGAEGCDARAL